MPWVDQSAAQHLQQLYERSRRPEFLRGLYAECESIARVRLAELARGAKRPLVGGELGELAHQAAARLICRYHRRPDYHVVSFWKVLGHECRHAFYDGGHKDRGKQKFLQAQVPLDCARAVSVDGAEAPTDPRDYRKDILADHPIGWVIDRDLREARTYREAIERIAGYIPQRWIYDHAVQLRYVYRVWRVRRPRCAASR